MAFMDNAHRAVDRLANTWPVRGYLQAQYDRTFAANRTENLFRGVFETFDDAQRSAPASLPLGYDNPSSASMYMDRTRKTYPTDYPVMFWLQKLFDEGRRKIFDLGGHIGVSYYAYRRHMRYPSTLRWAVHDVPAVVKHGRVVATEKDKDGYLSFCDEFNEADGMEVLVAQGSLQYLPETLADRLSKLQAPPARCDSQSDAASRTALVFYFAECRHGILPVSHHFGPVFPGILRRVGLRVGRPVGQSRQEMHYSVFSGTFG